MDKINEVKSQLEQNPDLGKHFTGKFTEGKKDGIGEFRYENGDFF